MFPHRKEMEFAKELNKEKATEQTLDSKEHPNVIENCESKNGNQNDLIFTKMAKEKLLVRILNFQFGDSFNVHYAIGN